MKRIIALVLCIFTILSLASCGNNKNRDYVPLDLSAIEEEYDENAPRAKEKYIGSYVEVTGNLAAINTYTNITIHMPDDSCIGGRRVIICKIKDKDAKEKVKELSVNETITVRGKITKLFGLWDCHIDVYEIE